MRVEIKDTSTDFNDIESCKHFLNNLYQNDEKVDFIVLSSGRKLLMNEIPDDEVIKCANELRRIFSLDN